MSDGDPDENETPDHPTGTCKPEEESDPSMFADLVDRIEKYQFDHDARAAGSDASERPDEDTPATELDPLDRVRELVPDDLPPPPLESKSHFRLGELSGNQKLYVGIALGIVLTLVLPGIIVVGAGHVTDTVFAPSPSTYVDENDTLYLEADDSAYLSRVFQETTHEVAYCGLITHDEDHPRLDVWMANTVNAGPRQVKFITENCPDATREVLLHTHPTGDLQLSEQDKQTLATRSEEFMCVQGGPLTTTVGATVENLGCYRQLESSEGGFAVSSIRIIITGNSWIGS